MTFWNEMKRYDTIEINENHEEMKIMIYNGCISIGMVGEPCGSFGRMGQVTKGDDNPVFCFGCNARFI